MRWTAGGVSFDAHLAVDLLDQAQSGLADDPAGARCLVEAALELWRGTPCAVDDYLVVPAEAHHLEALHRDAEELRVELLLLAGEARAAEKLPCRP